MAVNNICPFCGGSWGAGEQCQQCGVPRQADPARSLTEPQIGPMQDIMLLNPVNRGVAMGYSRWAGGAVEQRESSLELGIMVAVGAAFGLAFLALFGCVALVVKPGWFLIAFGLLAFIGAAALVISKVRQVRANSAINQRFAAEGGALIPGEVTSSRIRYIGSTRQHNRRRRIGIAYQFRTPDGRTLTGQGRSRYAPPPGNILPPPGTRVAVLYLDDQHYKAL